MVALSTAQGAPSLVEQAEAKEKQRKVGVQAHPLVRAALEQFPGAVIVAVRGGEADAAAAPLVKALVEADGFGYGDEAEDEDF
jgi:DNA polymerase-3 subunit gamma/tau